MVEAETGRDVSDWQIDDEITVILFNLIPCCDRSADICDDRREVILQLSKSDVGIGTKVRRVDIAQSFTITCFVPIYE